MSEEFESERTATRDEAAAVLRDLADGVAGGSLRLGRDEDDAIDIDVPDSVEVEIEFETEDGEAGVEIELEWSDSTVEGEPSATEGAEDAHVGEAENAHVETEGSPIGPAEGRESLARFEVFLDKGDEWRWRLVHRNGNVIATGGEGYTRKHNALKGLRSVMRNSPDAEVREDSDR